MKAIENDQLLKQLRWRYATKQFDPTKKISPADWAALEQALVLAPSSYGLQPYRFIVVTDSPTREKLMAASWNQRQVVDCSHLVVFAAKTKITTADVDTYLKRIIEVRGGSVEALNSLRGMMMGDIVQGPRSVGAQEWAARQAYIAIGNLMTTAALLGIDTCPMEGFEPPKYDAILGLREKGLATTVLCAAGYRAATDKYAAVAKVRFKPEDLIVRI